MQFDVPPNQIQDWKKKLIAEAENLFGTAVVDATDQAQLQQKLPAKIGQLAREKDFLANAFEHGR